MPVLSAGLLLFRYSNGEPQVFLVHPGGPFWAKKDEAAWSVPKGVVDDGEEHLAAARREFTEETGIPAPEGPAKELGTVSYGNKDVMVWAMRANVDAGSIASQVIMIEWPPKSGHKQPFLECDRAEWFDFATARRKLVRGQVPFIDRLAQSLSGPNAIQGY